MKTILRIPAFALGVLAACTLLVSGAEGAVPSSNTLTVQGVVVHLGIKQAQSIKAQPERYSEIHARGRIPGGRNDHYLFVALFDTASGKRITDARVSTRVSPLGLAGPRKELEPLSIGGAITYGNFFELDAMDVYVIGVEIRKPSGGDPLWANFEYRRPSRNP